MGWERRRRGGHYYYRSQRKGDLVIKGYVGRGVVGRLAEITDERAREQRCQQQKIERAHLEEFQSAKALATQYFAQSRVVISAALLQAGYYQHDRGEWRRRNGKIPCI